MAVILTACLGIGWVAALTAVAWAGHPLSSDAATYLTGLGHTVAGAAAVVIGYSIRSCRDGEGRHRE